MSISQQPTIQCWIKVRVARLAFLTLNFTNAAFLEALGVKKLFGFWLFLFNICFFGGSWQILSDWCSEFLNILLKIVMRLFRQCLVYFFTSHLETHIYQCDRFEWT